MEDLKLFKNQDGEWMTTHSLRDNLMEMGAHDCQVLFVHSALNFGSPNPKLKNKELLGAMLEVLESLNVPTLCMPTFTFSFPNGKEYNPATSKSRMGALNEFFRKQPGVLRSNDPLMSVALKGVDTKLVTEVGTHSISEGSTYDMIHHMDGVKFLFLGPQIGDCMTFMHYLEWLFDVDYRYIRAFRGKVVNGEEETIVEQDLFVRYNGVLPNDKSFAYGDIMVDAGVAKRKSFGGGHIELVSEKDGTEYYKQCLLKDPHFFVDVVAPIKDRTFKLNQEMIAL